MVCLRPMAAHVHLHAAHGAIETEQVEGPGINVQLPVQDVLPCVHLGPHLHHVHQPAPVRLERLAGEGIVIIEEGRGKGGREGLDEIILQRNLTHQGTCRHEIVKVGVLQLRHHLLPCHRPCPVLSREHAHAANIDSGAGGEEVLHHLLATAAPDRDAVEVQPLLPGMCLEVALHCLVCPRQDGLIGEHRHTRDGQCRRLHLHNPGHLACLPPAGLVPHEGEAERVLGTCRDGEVTLQIGDTPFARRLIDVHKRQRLSCLRIHHTGMEALLRMERQGEKHKE